MQHKTSRSIRCAVLVVEIRDETISSMQEEEEEKEEIF